MIGCNLPENREIERKLLTNDEVLAVNQTGQSPKQLFRDDKSMIWYSIAPNHKGVYVALFNISDKATEVSIDLSALGFKGKAQIRDLWKHQNLGAHEGTFAKPINKHGAGLFLVSGGK